jgi:ribonuclease P protein component
MQRQFRLRRSADFERLRAEGRTWRHPLLTLSAAPNQLTHNRYGFIASRRLGVAVVRNRTRRVLREIVRTANPVLKPGFDIVLIARDEIVGQPYSKVREALEGLFKRAGLWQQAQEDRQP